MKLTSQNVDGIVKVIGSMRGAVTRSRIHKQVVAKVVEISARQLFAHPEIHKAYEAQKVAVKKKAANPTRAAPRYAAEVIEQKDRAILMLEEKISLLYSNAAAQGVSPEQLRAPMMPIDFGNTYGREGA